jgi:hypothetical protein
VPADQYALNEPAILALVARLQDPAQLNAEVADIASKVAVADQAASLIPVDPALVYDFVPPPSFLTSFPAIGIQDLPSTLEDDTGSSATGKHELGIVIFYSNPDQRLLAWALRRYAQAVTRTAVNGRNLESDAQGRTGAWGTGFLRVAWGPTLSSKATPTTWLSFCVVQIWCRREEI